MVFQIIIYNIVFEIIGKKYYFIIIYYFILVLRLFNVGKSLINNIF
jgi:hypothetical protein